MSTSPKGPGLPEPIQSVLDAIHTDEATLARRYVRVTSEHNGIIAFEFSVGWPDMSVELALPEAHFKEFCSKNNVEFLTEAVGEKLGDQHDEH
jgi:phenol hydroxylase P0 protein